MQTNFYNKSTAYTARKLKTGLRAGLSEAEASLRIRQFGANKLAKTRVSATRLSIFLEQWKSPLILILLIAGAVSAVLRETADAVIIFSTALLNAFIGFVQEDKANRAMQKLRDMIAYKATVIRNGRAMRILSERIVPGDILIVEAGDSVQADGRLIEAQDLRINESALTGESEPVQKSVHALKGEHAVADRVNMVFRGTSAESGRGKVIVTGTGMATEIGAIAGLVSATGEDKTPLQMKLASLARVITVVVSSIAIVLFAFGLLAGNGRYGTLEMFETSIAIAVSAIPEGLVISLTVVLAIGMQYILRRNALVRRMVAAETLGSVSVICTDKTGTLTRGKMRITRLAVLGRVLDSEELGALRASKIGQNSSAICLLQTGALCNDAVLENPKEQMDKWRFLGESTESALLRAAMKSGINLSGERVGEMPFQNRTRYMATVQKDGEMYTMHVKGAYEVIIARSTAVLRDGEPALLTSSDSEWFAREHDAMAASGLRVLALAQKKVSAGDGPPADSDVSDLVLLGIVGISDPLRPGVKDSLAAARAAGIHVAMITGDHAKTAAAVGAELGIPHAKDNILEGGQIDRLADDALQLAVRRVSIFARVTPEHKIRIVHAFKQNGQSVAMTGDGVNDAPALKAADVGIAVGSGTDVAKETSDIVLLDDSFKTIVAAIEEGRTIYQNIKKVVLYLLSGSSAEVVMIFAGMVIGLPLPIHPVQILWVNIIEESLPPMALAFDRGDKENMSDPPRARNTGIIDKELKIMLLLKSLLAGAFLLLIFTHFLRTTGNLELARSIIFVGFAVDSLFYIFSIRSLRRMVWRISMTSNKYLLGAVAFGWIMIVLAVYAPPLQALLRTVPLAPVHWFVLLGFGFFNLLLFECIKWVFIMKTCRVAQAFRPDGIRLI